MLKMDTTSLAARLPLESDVRSESTATLAFDMARTHFFNLEDGRAIH